MTITEFLEARIAEDEAEAERGGDHNGRGVFARDNYGSLLVQPARVLAECAAKRAILELADDQLAAEVDRSDASALGASLMHNDTVRALASVYATHPDYRQEWAL